MTSVATAPGDARASVRLAIEELQRETVSFLREQDEGAALRDLYGHLRDRGHADSVISRAVANMLSMGRLRLTGDRRVLLLPK